MLSNLNLWSYLYKHQPENENIDIKEDVEKSDVEKADVEKADVEEINKDVSNTEKAKEWGNYILGVGKTAKNIAAKQVSSTAKQIRQNVSEIGLIEQSNIISKFSVEQTKFMEEKRLLEKKKREARLPWIDDVGPGNDEQHILKTKILSISSDERNFLRNPPAGSGFEFNYDLHAPLAQMLMNEDSVLTTVRYKLVPKRISEEIFWKNYFYRVFLIKQSLKSDTEGGNSATEMGSLTQSGEEGTIFVRDKEELSKEDIQKIKLVASKMDSGKENEEWEAELQKELSEFELVNEENGQESVIGDDKGDYDDLEREILSELEK